jgi:hypothetical protein
MLIIEYFDWFGTQEELKKLDEDVKKACTEVKGVTYKGIYSPHQKMFQWDWVFESDSYDKFMATGGHMKWKRDYKDMPHGQVEAFAGPV